MIAAVNQYSQPLHEVDAKNKIEFLFNYNLIYKESSIVSLTEANYSQLDFRYSRQTSFGLIGIQYLENNYSVNTNNLKTNFFFDVKYHDNAVRAFHHFEDELIETEFQMKLNFIEKRSYLNYSLGFALKFPTSPISKVQFTLVSEILPFFLNSKFNGESFSLNHSLQNKSFGLGINFQPMKNTILILQSSKSIPAVVLSTSKFNTNGEISFKKYEIGLKNSQNRFSTSADVKYFELGSESTWNTEGQTFGGNNIHDVQIQIYNLASQYFFPDKSFVSCDVSYITGKGKFTGNLQTWPFTSFITSVVSNRINFRAEGEIKLISIIAGYKKSYSNFSIFPEISFYHIIPEFSLQSWQPAFLVFGVKDFTNNTSQIKTIDLLRINLVLRTSFYSNIFELDFSQFVPVLIRRKEREELPLPTSSPKIETAVDGGRFISLKIIREF